MRLLYFILLLFVFSSCQKEMLYPENLPKAILLQVDYKTNIFEGAKEFSYFEGDDIDKILPVQLIAELPNPKGNFYVIYSKDTIFKGVQINQGTGSRIYPDQMDSQLYYLTVENDVVKPADSLFRLYNDDVSMSSIDLTKLWKAISKVRAVNKYRNSNSNAEIGLFLFRPSFSNNDLGDWKWYFILKN